MELKLTKKARITLFVSSYVLLVLFVGLRWETGNDWAEYSIYYKHMTALHDNYDLIKMDHTYEIGYKIVTLWMKVMGLSFAGFNLAYSAVYLGLMFASFRRDNYKISGWLILQLYAPFLLGLMGTMRQVMSVAICMFAIRYLLSRKLWKFLCCVGIAALFHVSALAFLVAWPIARIRLNFARVCAALAFLVVLSMLNVGSIISNLAGILSPGSTCPVSLRRLPLSRRRQPRSSITQRAISPSGRLS